MEAQEAGENVYVLRYGVAEPAADKVAELREAEEPPEPLADPPDAPSGLSATAAPTSVTLSWDQPDDDTITSYQILRRNQADEPTLSVLVDDTGSADTRYFDDSVEPEGRYIYRIRARNQDGLSLQSNQVNVTVPAAPPAVTVSFETSTYGLSEGGSATVTVNLSADPERELTIPITRANQDGATDEDLTGMPDSVSIVSGGTEATFTVTATDDADDDDGESVALSFGTLPDRVSAETNAQTTISIHDNDPTPDPDSTRDTANNLGDITNQGSGRTRQDTVNRGEDTVDYYKFTVSRAKKVTVWLEDLDVDAGLYLEDTKGRRLKIRDSSWATDRWFEISVERGTYYIRVQAVGNGSNSYNLRYQTRYQRDDYARSTNTTGTITVNGSRTGEIEFTGDRDWFATQLTSGQTYWIEHKGRPTEHGTLTNTAITGIFDAAGSSVRWTRDDDSGVGGNARVVFTPTSTGRHYIEASAYKRIDWDGTSVGRGAQGTYSLFLTEYSSGEDDDFANFTNTTGQVQVGASIQAEIETVGDQDWFALELTAGHDYRIAITGAFQASSEFTMGYGKIHGIYGADGSPAEGHVADGSEMSWDSRPDASGKHFVSIWGDDIYILGSNQEDYDNYHSNLERTYRRFTTIGTYKVSLSELDD